MFIQDWRKLRDMEEIFKIKERRIYKIFPVNKVKEIKFKKRYLIVSTLY